MKMLWNTTIQIKQTMKYSSAAPAVHSKSWRPWRWSRANLQMRTMQRVLISNENRHWPRYRAHRHNLKEKPIYSFFCRTVFLWLKLLQAGMYSDFTPWFHWLVFGVIRFLNKMYSAWAYHLGWVPAGYIIFFIIRDSLLPPLACRLLFVNHIS